MVRSLPPLNWVRAFEAAARHEGFLRAAQELGVSAGAVSQQIKLLERRLGAALFERHARGVRLTKTGSAYRDALGPALDAIDQASRTVSDGGRPAALRIAALPAIAEKWLTPRLSRFQAIAPEIAVQLITAETVESAAKAKFDVAVHYETEVGHGLASMPLFRDEILPVCSPVFCHKFSLKKPADLLRCRLLYDTKWMQDWGRWCEAAGLPLRDLTREFGFSLYNMAVEAAIEGQGVLIGHKALVSRELAAGNLIAPFDLAVPAPHFYVAMYADADGERPQIAQFLRWLQDEAA